MSPRRGGGGAATVGNSSLRSAADPQVVNVAVKVVPMEDVDELRQTSELFEPEDSGAAAAPLEAWKREQLARLDSGASTRSPSRQSQAPSLPGSLPGGVCIGWNRSGTEGELGGGSPQISPAGVETASNHHHPRKQSTTALDEQCDMLMSAANHGILMNSASADQRIQERLMTDRMGVSAKVRLSSGTALSLEVRPPRSRPALLLRWYALRLLASQRFDMAIGVVILVNSISIGVESSFQLEGRDMGFFEQIEHIFLFVYSVELGLRFFAQGLSCLRSGWVVFDLVLVGMGVISTWVVTPIWGAGAMKDELGPVMVLRVMRLLRLARAVRLLVQFKTLWMLVRGLLSSVGTMFYTFSLIGLILYVYACMGVELITKSPLNDEDEDFRNAVQAHFSGIFHSMLTLTQFVTLDSAASIYKPLIMKDPFMLTAYFMSFILIVAVSLMNLVTAVIVEGALDQGKADRDVQQAYELAKVKEMVPRIRELFQALDTDGSGDITLDEVLAAEADVTEELQKIMKTEQLAEVFELLDVDGSGQVDVAEFCDGIAKVVTTQQPMEFIRIMKQLKQQRDAQKGMVGRLDNLERTVANVSSKVDAIAEHLLGTKAA